MGIGLRITCILASESWDHGENEAENPVVRNTKIANGNLTETCIGSA